MIKIAIALGLVIILVFGTFGGMVMAAPEQIRFDCCDYILEMLDEIKAMLLDTQYEVSETGEDVDYIVSEVEEIGYEVSETGEDVDYIVSEVEEIGYEVSETGEDVDYVVSEVEETGEDVDYIVSEVEEIGEDVDYVVSEVSNVVRMDTDYGIIEIPAGTTKTVIGGDYDEIRHVVVTLNTDRTLDEGDGIYVSAYWPGNLEGCIVAAFLSGSDDKAKTIEFNADKWTIDCESGRTTEFTVKYVVTSTYVPAVPQ